MIEDTSKLPNIRTYAQGLGLGMGGSKDLTRLIEGQERSGQEQLVNSDRLPTNTFGTDDQFIAVGFTFGIPDRDALFRPATLPAGWTRKSSDHAMWSYLLDELGRKRVAIFYKAAFYDRDAHMRLDSQQTYLSECLYENTSPVLDDVWLTREVALATLASMAEDREKRAAESDELANKSGDSYWSKDAKEQREKADKIRALAASLAG